MQCVEFEDRLNRLLDHRLSPDDDQPLCDHAQECQECAGLLHAQQRLFAGLGCGRIVPPVSLAERVVSQQHLEVSHREATWRKIGWGVLLASAASLGGLALLALKDRDGEQVAELPVLETPGKATTQGTGLAIGRLGPTKVKPPVAQSPVKEEKFDEYYVVLENFASQISEYKEFDEMSESLEPSFKPIRSSFGLAIDALRRTLPRGKEARPMKPDGEANWLPDTPAIS